MTCLAIGAATRPPVASLDAGLVRARRRRRRSAASPGRAGEADDPGVRARRVGAELGGAGLAADLVAGDLQAGGGAAGDHVEHGRPAWSRRVSGLIGCSHWRRCRSARRPSPSLSRTSRMHVGLMIVPPLAMPAATSAICSGVAGTSFWPIDDWASAGRLRGEVGREARGDRAGQVDRRLRVEAERLGAGDHHVGPDRLGAHLGERGVARHREDREQRAAAGLAAEVADRLGGAAAACSCVATG